MRSVLALIVAVLVVASARADSKTATERWYALSLGGESCGYMHGKSDSDGDQVRTLQREMLRLGRAETPVTIEIEMSFVETKDGVPIEATVRKKTGGPESVTTYRFKRDGKEWSAAVNDAGRERVDKLPADGWLTPNGVDRFVAERVKAKAKEISYRMLSLEMGLQVVAVSMKYTGDDKSTINIGKDTREIPVTVWEVKTEALPIASTERYSSDGELIESIQRTGIGEIKTRIVDEKTAKAALANSNVEVLVRSFVQSPRPIRGARESDHLKFKITSKEGELADLPTAGAQEAKRLGPNAIELDVDVHRSSAATKEELADPKFRDSSSLIDSDSKEVKELLATIGPRKPNETPLDRANQLRRAAYGCISNKNLASAFASASEAVRTRSGDCSEHAVLLAALLRADGIPARLATGVVYADDLGDMKNAWGWHVWTQACLPTGATSFGWIDFDATLPTQFDAAHISTGVSDLTGGSTDPLWGASLSFIGNIAIDVVDVKDAHKDKNKNRDKAPVKK